MPSRVFVLTAHLPTYSTGCTTVPVNVLIFSPPDWVDTQNVWIRSDFSFNNAARRQLNWGNYFSPVLGCARDFGLGRRVRSSRPRQPAYSPHPD